MQPDFSAGVKNGSILLVETAPEKYFAGMVRLLNDAVTNKGMECIYITFNRPYAVLYREFKAQGIDVSKLYFIDAITRLTEDADMDKQCNFVDSPKELTTISTYVRNQLGLNSSSKRFVLVDSFTALLNFVPAKDAITFIQNLTNKLRLVEVGGSIMAITDKGKNPVELKDFMQLFDDKILIV